MEKHCLSRRDSARLLPHHCVPLPNQSGTGLYFLDTGNALGIVICSTGSVQDYQQYPTGQNHQCFSKLQFCRLSGTKF
ncbi:UNVERIFIED_CONTAM: hypothetical protein K2H54_032866 [Gekko kuhli]